MFLCGAFGVSPTLGVIVTCRRRGLFGSFGKSGFLLDGNVIISYNGNFGSVDWIARPFGTTENQIYKAKASAFFGLWEETTYSVEGCAFGILSLYVNVLSFSRSSENL